ncbi:MFS transporter [Belnapia sp. T18]|uniref:MFS transporter n=1 Tax=Belnapia arida TaxID=2804533 RepID=A0ABS1TZ49_9PROT|nr:MFS transporter [Belnapia arida]MBL6076717.1 MFS transporter [Belnapia arida]
MPQAAMTAAPPFFGWRVVWAAFTVAVFGWGVGFYGPPVFLPAIQAARGWPVALISAAVTCHFLLGAVIVANLAALHGRFGIVAVTRAAALASAFGILGWALAAEPWQLFAATLLSGFGWAATGGAAINAMVSPWFARRRSAALSTAYNGASLGGILFSPLWVALIAVLGFVGAAALAGGAMVLALWWLSGRYLAPTPASLGQYADGEAAGGTAPAGAAALPGRALWRDRRFLTLAAATSLGLFAQIGLIAHLISLLIPAMGAQGAGFAAALATVCAIAGRTGLGWLLPAEADRRRALAAIFALQVCGSLVLLAAGGVSVPLLLIGVVLFGLGLGNATSLPPLIAQQDFAAADTARAVALVTACSQAAYAFAPAAFGLLRTIAEPWLFLAAAAIQAAAAAVVLGRRAAA